MKNQESNLNESMLTQVSCLVDNQQHKNTIFCPFNQPATLVCMNQKCNNNAYLCIDNGCSCKKQHDKCYNVTLQSLVKNIESKQIFTYQFQQCINNKVQEMIDMLSKYRDQTILKIKQDLEFLGMNQNQKNIIKQIKNGKYQNTTGSIVWKIIYSDRERQKVMEIVEQTSKVLQSIFKKAKQQLENNLNKIKTIIQKVNSQVNQFLSVTEVIKQLKQKQLISSVQLYKSINKSRIITSLNQFLIIQKLFAPKTLKSAKILYRASQNNFQVKKFHQKCDGIPHTLILVETEFDKKIGGYTPIKWASPEKQIQVADESMQSFLFSLTTGDKFQLTLKEDAVFHSATYGPSFTGGADLLIGNKANENSSSYGRISFSYKNKNYKLDDRESQKRFHGNPDSSWFKLKQWQVWVIELN